MSNYIQVSFTNILPEQQDLLIALLSNAAFEGFEELPGELRAFLPEKDFDPAFLDKTARKYSLTYSITPVPARNWNADWEAAFEPVSINSWVSVRAAFHPAPQHTGYDIIITPKMSFGTGHHATTFLMIEAMCQLNLHGKTVLDFGTGTGILAILACKMGARRVLAIDIDPGSIENAAENIAVNNCRDIILEQASHPGAAEKYDLILANINKNVLLHHLADLAEKTSPGGTVLLSGILEPDREELRTAAAKHMLVFAGESVRDNWLSVKLIRD